MLRQKLKLMEEISFFKEFSQEERQVFAENENFSQTYQKGDYLVTEGDTDDALLVLISGQVNIIKNSHPDRIIVTLNPGAIIGEISFLTKRTRSTHVVASGDVIAFKLDSQTIIKEQLDPDLETKIRNQLIEILVQRLEETNQSLMRQKESNLILTKALRERITSSSKK